MGEVLIGQDGTNAHYALIWQHELLTTVDMVMATRLANSKRQHTANHMAPFLTNLYEVNSIGPLSSLWKKKKSLLKGRNRYLGSVSSGHNSVSTTICRLTKSLFYLGFDIILPQTRGNNLWGEKENDPRAHQKKKSQALNI